LVIDVENVLGDLLLLHDRLATFEAVMNVLVGDVDFVKVSVRLPMEAVLDTCEVSVAESRVFDTSSVGDDE
jgi:hypothetical protein